VNALRRGKRDTQLEYGNEKGVGRHRERQTQERAINSKRKSPGEMNKKKEKLQ